MSQDIQAVSYCIGLSVADSLLQQDLGGIDPTVMAQAISDVFQGKTMKYSPDQANEIIQKYVQELAASKFEVYKKEGEEFLAENAKKEGVTTTASGLQYEVVELGTGAKPKSTDTVNVHYHGTLIDGTVFDSSVTRGIPATFGVHQVIKGWTEALQLMPVGSKYRLYIPEDLAYGAHPHPGGAIKPFMTLIFDVELLGIENN
ncbi:MAG: Peptidylprolyl isomerase [Fluviicola sp.]|jgi:FKBP-type peptidyl-prolyl cis-trans isomerase FklB|uniref:FKBP-type peptidyl-prolyl cis-trans isomerase n=1 Tax=Fluviicola sp. TaxID=1917219 RepID=UPI00262630D0|nr:FKBP-type peptidyl-prolyl cis-trans isomerase [Fluviicola sp.]MDF3025842.1 Peptidylprolyl isomerase [Fluviicola sp.]